MRLLADENFPLPTLAALRHAGHDVTWVRTDLPGTGDAVLLDIAVPEHITPLVLRTMAADQDWTGRASVVSPDRVLMVRPGRSEQS